MKFKAIIFSILILIGSTFFAVLAQDEDVNEFGMTQEEMLERHIS